MERDSQLNADLQRIATRDKKAFLNELRHEKKRKAKGNGKDIPK